MKRALVTAIGAALCVTPIIVGTPLLAQTKAKASAYKAPRNALGQPDLSGYWSNATLTPESRPAQYGERLIHTPEEVARLEAAVVLEIETGNQSTDPNAPAPKVGGETPPPNTRPEFIAAGGNVGGYNRGWLETGDHVMRVNGEPRTSFLTTPNGRPPARKTQAAAPAGAGRGGAPAAAAAGGRGGGGGGAGRAGPADNPEQRSLGDRCIISFGRNAGPPMLPNGFYNNNYHFVQSKDAVAIVVEMVHDTRVIRLNAKHRTDGIRPWFGDSIGWWEGDTLVAETTHIPQRLAYQGSWENLKVTERFTRVSPTRMHYRYTVEDPTVWDGAWGGEYEFNTLNGKIEEYACHEGNYALEGILAGERNAERMAAQGGGRGTQ